MTALAAVIYRTSLTMKYLIIFLLFALPFAHAQKAEEIVNRYLDTVSNGNIENWNKIKSIYIENESYSGQPEFEKQINFLKIQKPNFNRLFGARRYGSRVESYDDSSYTNLKSTFYFLKDKTVVSVPHIAPMITKNNRKNSEFFSEQTPVYIRNLLQKSSATELLGIKKFENGSVSCYQVKIRTAERDYYLYFNTETYLLEYWNVSHMDQSFLTRFYNYKKIGDFLMPMSTSAMRDGIVYQWNDTRKIELNPEIDPKLFIYSE